MQQICKTLKKLFHFSRLPDVSPNLKGRGILTDRDLIYDETKENYEQYRKRVRERIEEYNRDNEVEVQIATFTLQKEVLQKTLTITWISAMISVVAVVVALLAVVVSLRPSESRIEITRPYSYAQRR